MNLLLDTNILLNIVRAKDYNGIIQFINPSNAVMYISVVSEAEIKSLALRNNWGEKRRHLLDNFLDQITIVEVNQFYIDVYAEIDAYSQRANANFVTYPFNTARNMGKNDLWIASLAALLGLKLVTTDADFDHCHQVFFDVTKLKREQFLPFF